MRKLLLLLLAQSVFAQTQMHLDVKQAVDIALRQNPTVLSARQAIDRADARIRQARADYYPQLGFNGIAKAGLSGATNALGLVGLPASPLYRNFADSLNASQSVFDSGRRKHRVEFEHKLKDAAEANLAAAEGDVILRVERAYYGLLAAQRLRSVTVEALRNRQAALRQAQLYYEAQIRSRLDLDLARANLARSQLQVTNAENRVRTASAVLGHAIGGDQDAEYALELPESVLPALEPLGSLIEEAWRLRPEIRSLRAERRGANEQLEYAHSQKKPFLNLAFTGGYARFTTTLARELMAGGAGLVAPLFTGGRLDGQENEARAVVQMLESREESLKQQVALEVHTAWFQLKSALDSLPVLALGTESAGNAVRLAAERYKERLGSFIELAAAQASLAEASAGESVGLLNVQTVEAELRRAIGRR